MGQRKRKFCSVRSDSLWALYMICLYMSYTATTSKNVEQNNLPLCISDAYINISNKIQKERDGNSIKIRIKWESRRK